MYKKKGFVFSLLLMLCMYTQAQEKVLQRGMKITKSMKVKKAIYKLDGFVTNDKSVILIQGENITIDFNNATLTGSNTKTKPDDFFGIAILIKNSNRITIKNLKANGFKIALLADSVTSLTIENCDFSYNYRQHLNSTQKNEDVSDWLSYHHNENDEWLRYGAAMYLKHCNMAIVHDNKVTGGQNALMMVGCNDGFIYNNDFSFNSGVGIALYRSSYNDFAYNRVDFNVRGYSHTIYSRGQDSAGFLVYEQSSNNLFYKNSATHNGDGFFLWAGQSTMDNATGGCNNNVLYANDFSYAATNGVEVTFSSNKIIENRIYECENGIWGGYSYNTQISNNKFRNNKTAIAIEHGQDIEIHHNLFFRDNEAIHVWSRKEQSADPIAIGWGYAKNKDVSSRNYIIAMNSFNDNEKQIHISGTKGVKLFGNISSSMDSLFVFDSSVLNIDTTESARLVDRYSNDTVITEPPVQKPIEPFKGRGIYNGRKNILMTEWGPYDFRSPIIWNANPTDTGRQIVFDIKGPKGKWEIKSITGLDSVSAKNGVTPATIFGYRNKKSKAGVNIELEFTGDEIVTPFGKTVAKNKPYTFSYKENELPLQWAVRWYTIDTSRYNPLKDGNIFSPVERKVPVLTDTITGLNYSWWNGLKANKTNYTQFATIAEAAFNFEKGMYEVMITWDKAVRVSIDGKEIFNAWDPSKYNFNETPSRRISIPLEAGMHQLLAEHVGLGDFSTLGIKILRVK